MKFTNQLALTEWKKKRETAGKFLIGGLLLSILLFIVTIYILMNSNLFGIRRSSSGMIMLMFMVALIAGMALLIFVINHFSNSSKYSLSKLMKNPDYQDKLEQYEKEFSRATAITPDLLFSEHYIFSYNRSNKQIIILPIEDIVWVYQGGTDGVKSPGSKFLLFFLFGYASLYNNSNPNGIVAVTKDKALSVLSLGKVRPVDIPEVVERISKELRNKNGKILLGYNEEYQLLYKKDFNSLIKRGEQRMVEKS